MAQKKAVLFNLWGVVTDRTPWGALGNLEEPHGLPRGFLRGVASREDSALRRAERGTLTLSQMIPELDQECVAAAGVQGVSLPQGFSVRGLLEELRETKTHPTVLSTSWTLRQHGLLTAVLANHWVDDSAEGDGSSHLLCQLGSHFDLAVQSCRSGCRVPEPTMFSSALQHLGVTPAQAVWLDVDEEGVKAAQGVGMSAILVNDLTEAFTQLAEITGVPAVTSESFPPYCKPEEVSHGYVTIKSGLVIHYIELGSGPPVVLCHGFPESWYSWRYQISALAAAGFRVLALDMKGYGETSAPTEIEEYAQEQMCLDLVVFLDKMSLPQVTLIGHDWGGAFVWNMAQYYPERVRAVASLNTPLFPVDPSTHPKDRQKLPIFDYQVYFQTPGVAEAELEKDLRRTFKLFFFGVSDGNFPMSTAGVCARGGLFVGAPEDVPRSSILTEEALEFYVSQFKERGFRGPLNWYRNTERDWKWMCSRPRGKLLMPSLMVTAGKDPVLLPVFTKGMEAMIPNLTRGHIEECGHWIQMEKPLELNRILINWLQDVLKADATAVAARL